jgi:hypothetical protein
VRQQELAARRADLLCHRGREVTLFAGREISYQPRRIHQRTAEQLLETMDEGVLAEHSFSVGSIERALEALPR